MTDRGWRAWYEPCGCPAVGGFAFCPHCGQPLGTGRTTTTRPTDQIGMRAELAAYDAWLMDLVDVLCIDPNSYDTEGGHDDLRTYVLDVARDLTDVPDQTILVPAAYLAALARLARAQNAIREAIITDPHIQELEALRPLAREADAALVALLAYPDWQEADR